MRQFHQNSETTAGYSCRRTARPPKRISPPSCRMRWHAKPASIGTEPTPFHKAQTLLQLPVTAALSIRPYANAQRKPTLAETVSQPMRQANTALFPRQNYLPGTHSSCKRSMRTQQTAETVRNPSGLIRFGGVETCPAAHLWSVSRNWRIQKQRLQALMHDDKFRLSLSCPCAIA